MDDLILRLKNLEELEKIQVSDPSSKDDQYMRGMANGLILAVATMKNEEPRYINPDGLIDALKEFE